MASLIVKTMLGEAATPKNVAILFAVITILLVAVMMYFFSKDCGDCSFRMLKYYMWWGLGAALIGYVVGQGLQMGPGLGMGRMGAMGMAGSMMAPMQQPQFALSRGAPVNMPYRGMATAPM